MNRPNYPGVSLTAHYTAYAWHVLGVPEAHRFTTRRGQLLFSAARPVRWLAPRIGLADPVAILLEARHRILEDALAAAGCDTYVEIAAGLSPRGTAYSQDPAVTYVEVDLPRMSALKERLVGPHRGPGHHLLAADATDPGLADRVAPLLAGRGKVAVVSEGLNAYLPRPAWRAVVRNAAALVQRAGGGVFLTDLNPAAALDRFGRTSRWVRRAIRTVARSPLYFPVRDLEDARAMLQGAGFREVTLHDPRTHPTTRGRVAARSRGNVIVAEAWV